MIETDSAEQDGPSPSSSKPVFESTSTNGDTKRTKLHRFSPRVAKWVGVTTATVFQFIRWWCLHHGQYTDTYEDLLEVFPYLTRKQLQLIIFRLIDDSEFDPLLVRKRIRGHNGYGFLLVDPKMKLKKLHSFDPQFALKYDVNMAVIYDDLVRWIAKNDEDNDGEQPCHYESPAQWAKVHGYMPLRTVERCFARLAKAGEIIQIDKIGSDNIPAWTITLGCGKLNRWLELHHSFEKEKRQKKAALEKAVVETKYVYVPVLYDPDLHCTGQEEPKPAAESVASSSSWHCQNLKQPHDHGSANT